MLYKRAFRKEKEVVTFLIKAKMAKSAWNLTIQPHPHQSEAAYWTLTPEHAVSLPCLCWCLAAVPRDTINRI